MINKSMQPQQRRLAAKAAPPLGKNEIILMLY
jgi:hypothetical protein